MEHESSRKWPRTIDESIHILMETLDVKVISELKMLREEDLAMTLLVAAPLGFHRQGFLLPVL
ncbi:hypothetical protein N9903_01275 [bacterium]|nr:hypothetical protein [bacterium]